MIKLMVAAHKKFRMPEDPIYLPVHVGAEGKTDESGAPLDLGFCKDNSGDHISGRNAQYCELTALYWGWKNLDADYIGLVHYRRYFKGCKNEAVTGDPFSEILTGEELEKLLTRADVIVPSKRRYYIETLQSHYAHTHFAVEIEETRNIISTLCPQYLNDYDRTMKQTWGYMFNMMIMPSDRLNEYCSWLFPILFELSDRLDHRELSSFEARYVGRVSELLFNVWLNHEIKTGKLRKDRICEIPFIYMEKINYKEKVLAFLKAKFLHRKQQKSF